MHVYLLLPTLTFCLLRIYAYMLMHDHMHTVIFSYFGRSTLLKGSLLSAVYNGEADKLGIRRSKASVVSAFDCEDLQIVASAISSTLFNGN